MSSPDREAVARAVYERATGILMERLGCRAGEARRQLARLAVKAGISPADLAADIAGEDLTALPAAARRGISRADAAMTAASDADALAGALLSEALASEGAESAAIWLLAPDGGVQLAGEAGFGAWEAARWRWIPPGVPSPASLAIRQERELWWPAGQPPGDDSVLIGQRRGAARAVVPLRQRGGCFGALEVCWPVPVDGFPEPVRRLLTALADPCAQALSAATPAMTARPDTSEAERLAIMLGQAQWLGGTGAWEENLQTGTVGWTQEACSLFGLPPGKPVRLADLHLLVPDEDLPAVQAFRDRLAVAGGCCGPGAPGASAEAPDARQPGTVTAAFRVIRADDGSVRQLRAVAEPVTAPDGELIAVYGAYQDVSDRYHAQAAFTATQEQLADSEERAREEHEQALRLQQAITPRISHPVEAAGIEVAARYRPAGQRHLVGGDWYDAVLLPDKSVLVAVGDVAGHGTSAVTGMVALRNYLRGLAITGAGPTALLSWLNRAACHLVGGTATAICGIYDPSARTLRWARAGHPPPIVVRAGKARVPPLPDGVMLGADEDPGYEEASLRLELGDVVVLYTDGLFERRDQSIDDALGDLIRSASRLVTDVSRFADCLLADAPSNTGDDTCLLTIGIR